jgi:hypothetical protein
MSPLPLLVCPADKRYKCENPWTDFAWDRKTYNCCDWVDDY